MPLCPQVVNTPITVVQTADFTVSTVLPGDIPATTGEVNAAVQASADGKNKVTYSTAAPGSTPNTAGDTWFQNGTVAPYVGKVIAQYRGNGGTSWTSVTVSGLVIANIDAAAITTGTLSAIDITGGTIQTSAGSNAVVLSGANNALGIKAAGTFAGWLVPVGSGQFRMHHGTAPSVSGLPAVGVSAGTASLATTTNQISINTSADNNMTGNMRFFNNIQVDGSGTVGSNLTVSGYIYNPGYQVSTSGGAARINDATTPTARLVAASGSSIRFKEDVVDIETVAALSPELLLTVPVRAFKYRDDYLDAEDERSGVLVPGFIAEELDAIYPVAVDHDAEGRASRWSADFIIPGLLKLIQEQEARITALENKLTPDDTVA